MFVSSTLKEDSEEMGAENLIHPRWENRNDEGLAKEEILGKYFSLLDDRDVNALYKIYKDDFNMFGYQFIYKVKQSKSFIWRFF